MRAKTKIMKKKQKKYDHTGKRNNGKNVILKISFSTFLGPF